MRIASFSARDNYHKAVRGIMGDVAGLQCRNPILRMGAHELNHQDFCILTVSIVFVEPSWPKCLDLIIQNWERF
jgi:hypothetical protein